MNRSQDNASQVKGASGGTQPSSTTTGQAKANASVANQAQSEAESVSQPEAANDDTNAQSPAQAISGMDPAIEVAIQSSLESSRAVRWHSTDGHSGYTVASVSQSYGNKECRAYQVTVARGPFRKDELMPDGLACKETPDGQWDIHAILPASG
jgi:surface antigen